MPTAKLSPSRATAGPRTILGIAVVLFVLTAAVFARGVGNGFISLDDPRYVTDNQHVVDGLSAAGWRWAWTTYEAANWHPLTWLSLQFDAQIGGLQPRVFHVTNVLLHALAAALLFVALSRLSGAIWRSALVAALFALHPLHVESVAWVAERKDVLSGLLAMLTLLAYARYVERPGLGRYACVLVVYALGLAAKPMLVTLPFVLLLLDYWPLARWNKPSHRSQPRAPSGPKRLVIEKVPLLVLALASCILTWQAQGRGEAVMTLGRLPLSFRLENALISYCTYLWQTILPTRLAAFYPLHRTTEPVAEAALAAAFLIATTLLAIALRRRYPYLLVGWLWYLGMLLPVIGLVQVGSQAHADRYTYLPLIGIFIVASWGLTDLAERFRARTAATIGAISALAVCTSLSWNQIAFWHDSTRLWEHALEVDPDNPLADTTLGALAAERGDMHSAVTHYEAALRTAPHLAQAHLDLALALVKLGKYEEAVDHYRIALEIGPDSAALHTALGAALARAGRLDDAAAQYEQALRLDPRNHAAHFNLGLVLQQRGDTHAAAAQYKQALQIKPDYENAAFALASIAWKIATDDRQQASDDAQAAVGFARMASAALANREPQLLEVVAAAYARVGSYAQAVAVAEQALALTGDPRQRAGTSRRLQLYRAGRPCRDQSDGP